MLKKWLRPLFSNAQAVSMDVKSQENKILLNQVNLYFFTNTYHSVVSKPYSTRSPLTLKEYRLVSSRSDLEYSGALRKTVEGHTKHPISDNRAAGGRSAFIQEEPLTNAVPKLFIGYTDMNFQQKTIGLKAAFEIAAFEMHR